MGIYSARFMESAIDDTIQTPGDTGIDLDQVEKDVAGPDGIASHEEEVEDATEGLVGDPVEEAFVIMYESEYNMNQIMQCIGMNELKEAAMGREFIFEAADKKGFFTKVKEALVNAFRKVTDLFKRVFSNISGAFKNDYKFVKTYERQIKSGAENLSKNKDKYFDLYEFGINLNNYGKVNEDDYTIECEAYVQDRKPADRDQFTADKLTERKKGILKMFAKADKLDAVELPTPKDYASNLVEHLYGKKKKIAPSAAIAQDAMNVLTGQDDVKMIKDLYSQIKDNYKRSLADIDAIEKTALKDIDSRARDDKDYRSNGGRKTDKADVMTICRFYSDCIRYSRDLDNVRYSAYLKCAKSKRAQARRICSACKSAASAVQHNSASMNNGSAFADVQLI